MSGNAKGLCFVFCMKIKGGEADWQQVGKEKLLEGGNYLGVG